MNEVQDEESLNYKGEPVISPYDLAEHRLTGFLLGRLFAGHDYESDTELLIALNDASAIDENLYWSERKKAFNEINERLTENDSIGYCVKLEDVVMFLRSETEAFDNRFEL